MLEIAGFPVLDAAPSALLAGVFVMVVVDKLVPAARRDCEVSFWKEYAEREIAEKLEWKQAAQANGKRADLLLSAVDKLAEKELSSSRVVETLQDLADQRRVP